MKIAQVKKLPIEERFLYWIEERESIRLKKETGEPKPWTQNEIFQKYKFCNVRRMDDKVSKWLLKNWYEPYFDHPNIVPAVALARFINKPESLEHMGFPVSWRPKQIVKKLEAKIKEGPVFNSAYMVKGELGESKIKTVVFSYCTPLKGRVGLDTSNMAHSVATLVSLRGFSTFMGGQVVADLRWAMRGSWADASVWAPVGPGSSRGIKRLRGDAVKTTKPKTPKMNQKQFDILFPDVLKLVHKKLPKISVRLEAIDIQNCLCEWDKYERVLWEQGRPKNRYQGN